MSDEPDISNTQPRSTRAMGESLPIPLTPAQREVKQRKFLKAYRDIGIIKHACKVAGINRSTFKYWRDHYPDFADLLPDAKVEANESLEIEAHTQARGVEEPAISAGQVVYEYEPVLDKDGNPKFDKNGKPIMKRGQMIMVKKFSPSVLITLLKANMPEKYKENLDVTANVNSHVTQSGSLTLNMRDMSDEQLAMAKALALSMRENKERQGNG